MLARWYKHRQEYIRFPFMYKNIYLGEGIDSYITIKEECYKEQTCFSRYIHCQVKAYFQLNIENVLILIYLDLHQIIMIVICCQISLLSVYYCKLFVLLYQKHFMNVRGSIKVSPRTGNNTRMGYQVFLHQLCRNVTIWPLN
jgi:hypothetical protein